MSLNSIMSIQKGRKMRRQKVFNDIYDKVKIRINHYAKFNHNGCTYQIPQLIYGLPHIDHKEIADFLENRLKEEGFAVIRVNGITLFVSWEESIVEEQARRDKLKRQMKRQEQELIKIEERRNNDLLKSLEAYSQ